DYWDCGGATVAHLSSGAAIHPTLSRAGQLPAAGHHRIPRVAAHLALPEPPVHPLHHSGRATNPGGPPAPGIGRGVQTWPRVAAPARPGAAGPDAAGTARACLDGQGRRGQPPKLDRHPRDTPLDWPGPLVALQLRLALAHQWRGLLRVAVHHGAVAAAGA